MNEQPNYYAILPASVRYSKNISAQEKLLFAEITALCNKEGFCWAGNGYFAELYGLSKETVSRQISKLVKNNFIRTQLIYFEDSKQIKERRIYILSGINTPIDENINTPIDVFVNTPIDENVKDNNTSINNTSINRSSSSPPPKTEVAKSLGKIEEEETTKDKKNEPFPPTGISSNELKKVQLLITNNLKTNLTDLQVSKIFAAANGDIKLIESRINSAKNSRKKITDIVAWLVAAVKSPDEDYKQVAFEPETLEAQKKNRIVNYKSRKWNHKKLEELEMQRLIAETEGIE